jgi:hypothetical protein
MGKEAMASHSKQNNRSEPTGLPAAWPSNALLEHAATKIRIVAAGRDIVGGLEQLCVNHARLAGEPGKFLRHENAHPDEAYRSRSKCSS